MPGLSLYDRPAHAPLSCAATSDVRQWPGFGAQFTSYAGDYPAVPALPELAAISRKLRAVGGRVLT